MARIEPLTEAYFAGAADVTNDFIGVRKGCCCGCISYRHCPIAEKEFARLYKDPARLHGKAIAIEDGTVVGFMEMTVHPVPQDFFSRCLHATRPGEAYIDQLAVRSGHRGQGIGTRLLEWGEATARERGAEVLTLGVVNGNPARRLYERFGFVPVEQERGCSACLHGARDLCLLSFAFGRPHSECGGTHMEKLLLTT